MAHGTVFLPHYMVCPHKHIGHQADVAFSESRPVGQKVCWIGAIGLHWIYGEIQAGQAPRPLIEWHDVRFRFPESRRVPQELACRCKSTFV